MHAIDGVAPSRVERPTDTAAVAAAIGAAHRARQAVVLHGGGTRIGVGDAPARYDVAIDLRELRGVVEHSAPDLVCTVRAGTTVAELTATLAQQGQRWPVDIADPERATVGGTISSAAPSPTRLRYQHPRDWVIGCEAVLGDGTIARAGGRVVKNVTGYDLARLYSGSYGTLAAITEVSLKLVAIDEARRTMRLRGPDLRAFALELRRELPLEAIVLARMATARDGAASGATHELYVRASGLRAAVDRCAAAVTAKADAARLTRPDEVSEDEWTSLCARPLSGQVVARCAVSPGSEAHVDPDLAFVGTGIAYICGSRSDEELRKLREACERMGGALVIERAPVATRVALGTWGDHRSPQRVIAALKQRFDPHAVLAPGRMPA